MDIHFRIPKPREVIFHIQDYRACSLNSKSSMIVFLMLGEKNEGDQSIFGLKVRFILRENKTLKEVDDLFV